MIKNRPRNRVAQAVKNAARLDHDFDELAEISTQQVEHLTVLQFLRTMPRMLEPDEIVRYGDKVNRMANALQLSWVPAMHPQLGAIRVFPLPLMQWLYIQMAQKFKWPLPTALENGATPARDEVRKNERTKTYLQSAAETAPDEVKAALAIVVTWLERENAKLSATAAKSSGAVEPPLRVV